MQIQKNFTLALAGTLMLTSCGKLGELTADNFTVTPSPMEMVGGQVPVTINGRFPEKYMKKKAVVTVTPVLRYQGGETVGQGTTFQGEKVMDNYQEISYRLGGNYTMRNTFSYVEAMQKSELYLTFKARLGKKEVNVPEVKVANGVVATADLAKKAAWTSTTEMAADAYQYAIQQTKEAQIKYLINQANIRTSEIKGTSVQEFLQTLRDIKADQKGYMLDNIEVSAYASPDGSMKVNTALAQKREQSSKKYVGESLKKNNLETELDTRYTAEDWDGFQQLLQASNVQDKDIILRVLSMYQDPEEREKQIRNISAGYDELAKEILPELRRARLTIHYNLIGRSDDEIQEQLKTDASKLSVEEMLYAATLTEDTKEQKDIYFRTTQLYPKDYRAFNNLASIAIENGQLNEAKSWLEKAANLKGDATEVNANQALVALVSGENDKAQSFLAKATTAGNYNELAGNMMLASGNYVQAASTLKGKKTNTAALAQILNKDYAEALNTLNAVARPDATTAYLKAIVAARTNRDNEVVGFLKQAFEKDPTYKERAARDLEFVNLFNDSSFQSLVK